jgi:hypothetical protein
MTVKAIVDAMRAAEGYAGGRIYAAGQEIFSENIDPEYAAVVLRLLRASASVRRVSVTARGFTFMGFSADGYDILLKTAGRLPPAPPLSITEPEFVDTSVVSTLPSMKTVRTEAEAALREFGLLNG